MKSHHYIINFDPRDAPDNGLTVDKAEVIEMCHQENLYQIDLLDGSKNRVIEREYWAKRKGQAALDKENASFATAGEPTKQTKFETDKEKLRQTIRKAVSAATIRRWAADDKEKENTKKGIPDYSYREGESL